MNSRRSNVLHLFEVLLWMAAAAALAAAAYVILEGHIYQFYLNRRFEEVREVQHSKPGQPLPPDEPALVAEPGPAEPQPEAEPYLGRLEIPRLKISAMVLDGIDSRTLRRGIGHIPGTAMPGQRSNIGIAGHRDTFFRDLRGIEREDHILVQTLNAEYDYVVESIRVVEPNATEVLENTGRPMLTLVTCYPFNLLGPAPRRFVVQASLLEP